MFFSFSFIYFASIYSTSNGIFSIFKSFLGFSWLNVCKKWPIELANRLMCGYKGCLYYKIVFSIEEQLILAYLWMNAGCCVESCMGTREQVAVLNHAWVQGSKLTNSCFGTSLWLLVLVAVYLLLLLSVLRKNVCTCWNSNWEGLVCYDTTLNNFLVSRSLRILQGTVLCRNVAGCKKTSWYLNNMILHICLSKTKTCKEDESILKNIMLKLLSRHKIRHICPSILIPSSSWLSYWRTIVVKKET